MKTVILITLTMLLSAFTTTQPNIKKEPIPKFYNSVSKTMISSDSKIRESILKTKPDPRLYDALSQSEVQEMLEKNPFLIQYYNYFLDHSYKIITKPKSNILDFPPVTITNMEHFNILVVKKTQKLKRDWESQTYYSIKGTNKVLVFISEREFTKKLNKSLGR